MNIDLCHSTGWAASSEPDGARPAEPMLLGRLLAPLPPGSASMHTSKQAQLSPLHYVPIRSRLLCEVGLIILSRALPQKNWSHFRKFVPHDMTLELLHLKCVTLCGFHHFNTVLLPIKAFISVEICLMTVLVRAQPKPMKLKSMSG